MPRSTPCVRGRADELVPDRRRHNLAGRAGELVESGAEVMVDFSMRLRVRENVPLRAGKGGIRAWWARRIPPGGYWRDSTVSQARTVWAAWWPQLRHRCRLMMDSPPRRGVSCRLRDSELHHAANLTRHRHGMTTRGSSWRRGDGRSGGEGRWAAGLDLGGIRIHSVRLTGLVAHQEVIFGDIGKTLTMRHDTFDRASFMPGVMLAIREVGALEGLVLGLDKLMGLRD